MPNPKVQILPLRKAPSPVSHNGSVQSLAPMQKPIVKKTRISKPKVRTGCVTCKIRRLKCDETKPACLKCTSTGRSCDGYVTPPPRRKPQIMDIIPRRNPRIAVRSHAELRAMEFFHNVTAYHMSQYLDAGFWTRLVFQMSFTEDTVRHAMAALGTLSETRDDNAAYMPHTALFAARGALPAWNKHCLPGDPGNAFGVFQYNKAISALGARLREANTPVEVPLLTCILFVCIEFLRGDPQPAINHFKSGMKIALATLSSTPHRLSPTLREMKTQMLPFFNRLELVSTFLGYKSEWDYPMSVQESVPGNFSTLTEARDSIVHLMNLSLRFVRSKNPRKHERTTYSDDVAQYQSLKQQLQEWKNKVDIFIHSKQKTGMDEIAVKVLYLHQIVTKSWIDLAMHRDELFSDELIPDFELAVGLAEDVSTFALTAEQRQKYASTVLFDMEITSLVYSICLKCRHPVIRRRASMVLKRSRQEDGVWHSSMTLAVVARLMAIEEKNLTVLDGSELPTEKDRIHEVTVEPESGSDATRYTITYYAKPDGLDGVWRIWQEDVVLEDAFEPGASDYDQSESPGLSHGSSSAETSPGPFLGRSLFTSFQPPDKLVSAMDSHRLEIAMLQDDPSMDVD